MSFHSVARAIQGQKITLGISLADGLVEVIPAVPENHSRYIYNLPSSPQPFVSQSPFSTGFSVDGGLAADFLLRRPDGSLFGLDQAELLAGDELYKLGFSENTLSTIILAPGESVVTRITGDAGGEGGQGTLDFQAGWIDFQGPFEHQRVEMTGAWQDVIPSPDPGKIHTPVGFPSATPEGGVNGFLVADGSDGGAVNSRVIAPDGSTVLSETDGISADPNFAVGGIMDGATGVFEQSGGVIPIGEGMSIQSINGGAETVGAWAFVSYLVTDAP